MRRGWFILDINERELILLLYPEFKCVYDKSGNEFVVFRQCKIKNNFNLNLFYDKTSFEATVNHIHVLTGIRKKDISVLQTASKGICKYYINLLSKLFPQKTFTVCISIKENESLIFRFHQNWENEPEYLSDGVWNDGSIVITEKTDA